MRVLPTGLVLLILGCQGGTPPTPTATPTQQPASTDTEAATAPETPTETSVVELVLDQSVSVGELDLRWTDLNDSRCPIGVTCVWEGQAVVTLEVGHGDAPPRSVELTLRAGVEPAAESVAGYQLRLLGVEPYPREGVTAERGEYVATVEIKAP